MGKTLPTFLLMEKEAVIEKVKEAATPILYDMCAEIVDITFRREGGRMVLRILADKEGGITLGDCAYINRRLSEILDQVNIIDQRYVLEVSSPGLDRPLTRQKDFQRVTGKPVRIITSVPVENRIEFVGKVTAADEQSVTIETKQGQSVKIPLEKIIKAKEVIKF